MSLQYFLSCYRSFISLDRFRELPESTLQIFVYFSYRRWIFHICLAGNSSLPLLYFWSNNLDSAQLLVTCFWHLKHSITVFLVDFFFNEESNWSVLVCAVVSSAPSSRDLCGSVAQPRAVSLINHGSSSFNGTDRHVCFLYIHLRDEILALSFNFLTK